jgi:FO synthase
MSSIAQSELETFPHLEWAEIAPRLSSACHAALELAMGALDGGVLSREQWLLLANSAGDDLLGLLVAANAIRRELAGNIVTYVVNRNINFTNICFVGCKFCAFSRGPREDDTLPRKLNKHGNSARLKFAYKAAYRAICLLTTIATSCAQ